MFMYQLIVKYVKQPKHRLFPKYQNTPDFSSTHCVTLPRCENKRTHILTMCILLEKRVETYQWQSRHLLPHRRHVLASFPSPYLTPGLRVTTRTKSLRSRSKLFFL